MKNYFILDVKKFSPSRDRGWISSTHSWKVRTALRLMIVGGPRRARTVDPRIKSPLLYRLSYRPHCFTDPDFILAKSLSSGYVDYLMSYHL
jgi:hypothetical protein